MNEFCELTIWQRDFLVCLMFAGGMFIGWLIWGLK